MTTFLAAVFGLIVGSFLNVVIYRLPLGQKLTGRSRCPACGHQLRASDLVPVVSYLSLGGRCRYCGVRVSSRYVWVELLTAGLFALTVWRLGTDAGWLFLLGALVFVAASIAVCFIDLEHQLILNAVTYPTLVAAFALALARDLSSGSVAGMSSATVCTLLGAFSTALPVFLLWWFSKGRWMGFGDVKYCLLLGATLGWKYGLLALFLAILLGGVVSLLLLLARRASMKTRLPFGVFLTLAGVAVLLFGRELLSWYLAALGF